MRPLAFLLLLACALQGCTSSAGDVGADVASVGVGTAVGALTGNPIIGLGAGLATRVALAEGVNYGERQYYGAIQSAIAEAAGGLEPQEVGIWSFEGPIGITGTEGEIEVVRAFGQRWPCKEIIFTVDDDENIYVGVVCQADDGWRWAVSEPNTDRWSGLQ